VGELSTGFGVPGLNETKRVATRRRPPRAVALGFRLTEIIVVARGRPRIQRKQLRAMPLIVVVVVVRTMRAYRSRGTQRES